jgi:histidinol dehydrogenase
MGTLTLRRIRYTDADAAARLLQLRRRLSLQADIVSPRGRALTEKVFGEALTPGQVVERICRDVRERGLAAVLHYCEQLDNKKLSADTLRVTPAELKAAHQAAAPEFIETIRRVKHRILAFQSGLVHNDARLTVNGKYELGMRYRPLKHVASRSG